MKLNRISDTLGVVLVVLSGALLGLIVTILFALGYAPNIGLIFIFTFIISLMFIAFLIYLLTRSKRNCFCSYGLTTLFASLFLLILSVLSLATTVVPNFFSFIVLVFLGSTAFFITIIGFFAFIVCLCKCTHKVCDHQKDC